MKIKKDGWDKTYIVLILFLTAIIAGAGIFTAIGTFSKIPQEIKDSSLNNWNRVYYEEALKWKGSSFDAGDPIVDECANLEIYQQKMLEKPTVTCADGEEIFTEIKKDQDKKCYSRLVGDC